MFTARSLYINKHKTFYLLQASLGPHPLGHWAAEPKVFRHGWPVETHRNPWHKATTAVFSKHVVEQRQEPLDWLVVSLDQDQVLPVHGTRTPRMPTTRSFFLKHFCNTFRHSMTFLFRSAFRAKGRMAMTFIQACTTWIWPATRLGEYDQKKKNWLGKWGTCNMGLYEKNMSTPQFNGLSGLSSLPT